MIGLYPLDQYPTTFDMTAWAVIARTNGCDHVRFRLNGKIDSRKYSEEIAWRRFGNILVPLCKLAGMTFSVGEGGNGRVFKYIYGHVEQCYREHGRIDLLKSTMPYKDKGYVTITLRDSFRNTFRNSNLEAWRRVEKTLKDRGVRVIVFKDCEVAPLSLEYRLAAYLNADMNLGVSNGPMTLCHFSAAPYITLNMAAKRPDGDEGYDPEALMASSGFPHGSQFSFRNDRQLLVWEPDTYENIMDAYDEMMQDRFAHA